jgi:hypothetical protein
MTQTSAQAQVPSELVGTWHYNWVSGVHQHDPIPGHWRPPTAVEITFVFTPDGQFELRDFRQTSSWCTLSTYETASVSSRPTRSTSPCIRPRGTSSPRATAAPTGTTSATGPARPARLGGAGVRMPSAARRWCWRGHLRRRTPMCRSRVGSRWRRTATGSTTSTVPPAEPRRLGRRHPSTTYGDQR